MGAIGSHLHDSNYLMLKAKDREITELRSENARIRELTEENQRLREANRRLQAEGAALERDKLVMQLRDRLVALEGFARDYKDLDRGDFETKYAFAFNFAIYAAEFVENIVNDPARKP